MGEVTEGCSVGLRRQLCKHVHQLLVLPGVVCLKYGSEGHISSKEGVIRCVKLVQSPKAEQEGHRDGEGEGRKGGELGDSQGRAPSLSMSTSFSVLRQHCAWCTLEEKSCSSVDLSQANG